jgi:excisionase family DNA binding protein
MATEMHLTTVEASNLAGVGPSTVKRWADKGLLPCVRTAGGHRRFERFALERFLRERAEVPGRREAALTSWVELLISGRRHDVDALLLGARARLGAWYRVADELGAMLTKLGEHWAGGLLTVAEEHLISDGLTRALGRVGQALPTRAQGPSCVLVCAEGDEHTLGLSLAELCLVELGWTPLWLGARTPTVETIRLAEKSGARMVAMSASAASSDPALLGRTVSLMGAACRAHDIDLVLGGEGAWPEAPTYGVRLRSFGAFHEHVSRLEHARRPVASVRRMK